MAGPDGGDGKPVFHTLPRPARSGRSTCTDNPNNCATGGCNVYCGGTDYSVSVAIGKGGIAYIGGWTSSPNFPTTSGALQPVSRGYLNTNGVGGGATGFIAAFDPSKSGAASLVFSTFLGGKKTSSGSTENLYSLLFSTLFNSGVHDGYPYKNGFVVDKGGNIYVASSVGDGLPTTPGAFQTKVGADSGGSPTADGYVLKLSPIAASVPTPDGGVGGAGGASGSGGAGGTWQAEAERMALAEPGAGVRAVKLGRAARRAARVPPATPASTIPPEAEAARVVAAFFPPPSPLRAPASWGSCCWRCAVVESPGATSGAGRDDGLVARAGRWKDGLGGYGALTVTGTGEAVVVPSPSSRC